MKIKSIFSLFFICIIILCSCSKDDPGAPKPDNSTMNLLTAKQWIPDSVYLNFTSSTSGILVYSRGTNNNILDYNGNRFVLWPDGSQDFFIYNTYQFYTWSFVGSDSTLLVFNNPNKDYARILKLTTNNLNLYDSTNSYRVLYSLKP